MVPTVHDQSAGNRAGSNDNLSYGKLLLDKCLKTIKLVYNNKFQKHYINLLRFYYDKLNWRFALFSRRVISGYPKVFTRKKLKMQKGQVQSDELMLLQKINSITHCHITGALSISVID